MRSHSTSHRNDHPSNFHAPNWRICCVWCLQSDSKKIRGSQSVNARTAGVIYRPLKKGQTRLVHLHSRQYEGKRCCDDIDNHVSCSLLAVNLEEDIEAEYEAVSYVWGGESDLHTMQLNQERFWVTRNLFAALRALRLPGKNRVLWIDALAINQSSLSERASQVMQMQLIYSSAKETLIWLNDDNLHDIETNPLWLHVCSRWGLHQTKALSPTENSGQTWGSEHLTSLLSGFSSLQYWHRVWTAQEVVYSQRATFVTPSGSAPFGILEDLFRPGTIEGHPRATESSLERFQKTRLTLKPNTVSNGSWINLETWVQMCISRDCYDPRDYVFGFSGCFPPEVRQQVRIDYFLGPDGVLKEATVAFLRQEGCLDYLRHSNCFNQDSRWVNGLPSWVPEFASERTKETLRHDLDRMSDQGTLSLGNKSNPVFFEILEDSSVLHVRGRIIGHVEEVDCSWANTLREETEEARALQLLRHLRNRMLLLRVEDHDLDDFCHTFRPLESGFTVEVSSALPTMLRQEAPRWASRRSYDQFLVSRHRRAFGDEALLTAYSSITILRFRDPQRGMSAFGITWGDGGNVKRGDKICLLEGCSHALLLRAANPSWWNLWKRHWRGQHRIIGRAVIHGGGSKEQNWFKEIRARADLEDVFLR